MRDSVFLDGFEGELKVPFWEHDICCGGEIYAEGLHYHTVGVVGGDYA